MKKILDKSIILFILFIYRIAPILFIIFLSVHYWNLLTPIKFVFLDNYKTLLKYSILPQILKLNLLSFFIPTILFYIMLIIFLKSNRKTFQKIIFIVANIFVSILTLFIFNSFTLAFKVIFIIQIINLLFYLTVKNSRFKIFPYSVYYFFINYLIIYAIVPDIWLKFFFLRKYITAFRWGMASASLILNLIFFIGIPLYLLKRYLSINIYYVKPITDTLEYNKRLTRTIFLLFSIIFSILFLISLSVKIDTSSWIKYKNFNKLIFIYKNDIIILFIIIISQNLFGYLLRKENSLFIFSLISIPSWFLVIYSFLLLKKFNLMNSYFSLTVPISLNIISVGIYNFFYKLTKNDFKKYILYPITFSSLFSIILYSNDFYWTLIFTNSINLKNLHMIHLIFGKTLMPDLIYKFLIIENILPLISFIVLNLLIYNIFKKIRW